MAKKLKETFRWGIRLKFALVIGLIIVGLMCLDAVWNVGVQQRQAINEAHEKAATLADEMHAVWRFIDLNQDAVNRNPDGTFRNKQLVCVVAAKSISMLFTRDTEYTIRFVSPTPRQASGTPDAFEAAAFRAFAAAGAADGAETSYYQVETSAAGNRVFRYAEPLYVTATCLECHGEPAGELDQYGYAKEGMSVGQIAGAISITEPMSIYDNGVRASVMQQLVMVLFVLAVALACVYVAMNRIVLQPLDMLRHAAKRIGAGSFDNEVRVHGLLGPDEMSDFARDFNGMAAQLAELYGNLEHKVAEQTDELVALNELLTQQKAALKQALDELNDQILSKNEFFAIVSHELRTPLTSILAYARILKDDASLDEKTRASVAEIELNATLLLNLVSNILTISKTEANKNSLVLEPVDFVDLVGLVRSGLAPVAQGKDVALTSGVAADVPLVMADWEKLRRVLENLVDNAIKYTHPGGHVHVGVAFEASPTAHGGAGGGEAAGCIVIRVSDDGMGIDPQDQEGIFERYRQARHQSPNRRYRGTGLGLAVVKDLTELHGGTVAVESRRHAGSTFTVRLPHVPVVEPVDEEE